MILNITGCKAHPDLCGVYEHVPDKLINGQPSWHHKDSPLVLCYADNRGFWRFSNFAPELRRPWESDSWELRESDCTVRSVVKRHISVGGHDRTLLPHEMQDWQRWAKGTRKYKRDRGVQIEAISRVMLLTLYHAIDFSKEIICIRVATMGGNILATIEMGFLKTIGDLNAAVAEAIARPEWTTALLLGDGDYIGDEAPDSSIMMHIDEQTWLSHSGCL